MVCFDGGVIPSSSKMLGSRPHSISVWSIRSFHFASGTALSSPASEFPSLGKGKETNGVALMVRMPFMIQYAGRNIYFRFERTLVMSVHVAVVGATGAVGDCNVHGHDERSESTRLNS